MTDDTPHAPAPESETLIVTPRELRVDPVMVKLAEATKGEYRVERELGRGGMATVYLAHDISLDRKVAIKVMGADLLAGGDVLVGRFLREARTGARLNHPHIIPVYAVRQTPDLIFFVMKFIDGKPLDDVIGGFGQLPIPLAARVIAQVADALAYAHRNGIVHRDIKPGNIMLDREGWVVLTDLGIAKVQEASMLTATGSAVGTPTYMSPEQSSGSHATTGASDQYSLGCVAFEMLTGKPPFEGESIISLIFQHVAEPPPPIQNLRPDCPAHIVSAVSRMLEKMPEDRFPSMEEVAQLFRDSSSGDEEEFRELLRAFATGAGAAEAVGRINTPRTLPTKTPSQLARAPQRASRRELSMSTTGMQAVPRDNTPASIPAMAIPSAGEIEAAAQAAKANWPRTLLKPPEQQLASARRFRTPGILTMLVAAFFIWFLFLPGTGSLATEIPQTTALMTLRAQEAEAAVRRGSAPGAEGSCEGIRADLASCRKHIVVTAASIAPAVLEAVVFAEDSLFTVRQGADWSAMRRAAGYPRDAFEWGNSVDRSDFFAVLPGLLTVMDRVGEAGSLTQRVVQNVYFPPSDGLFRKAREIRIANRLAKSLSKERILEIYVNVAEFGPGVYGIEAASQAYFNVSADKLTKAQAATLVATLATPRTSNPKYEPAEMRRRQALILRRLNGEAVSIPPATSTPSPSGP
jgi:serine/threonine protein kinase